MSKLVEINKKSRSANLNVILFHGLGGDARSTWQFDPNQSSWPEWLAEDVKNVRIASLDYDAPKLKSKQPPMSISDRAKNIATLLASDESICKNPTILIGHSLGGLIIKAVIDFWETQSKVIPKSKELLKNIKSVVLIAVPNNGSKVTKLLGGWKQSELAQSLKIDDANLKDLNDRYRLGYSKNITHTVFSENQRFRRFPFVGKIVENSSADPSVHDAIPIPIDKDHIEIAKPRSRDDVVYASIKTLVDETLIEVGRVKRTMSSRIKTHKSILIDDAKDNPFLILLCAPIAGDDADHPYSEFSRTLQKMLLDAGFEVVLGENAGIKNRQIHKEHNLISNELSFIKTKCSAVIIVAETMGTMCELGLYSWHLANDDAIRANETDFILLMDSSHETKNEFVEKGPFAHIADFGKAEFIDIKNHHPKSIVDRLKGRRSYVMTDKRGRPHDVS